MLDNEILAAALQGLEAQKRRLDQQIAEVRSMMSGTAAPASATNDDWESPGAAIAPVRKKRRKLSAASRKAMAAAQKKRWAAYHAAQAGSEK